MKGSVAVVVALLALTSAPAAHAAETIGSSLLEPPGATPACAAPCSLSTTAITNRPVSASARGVITRWQIRAGATPGPVRLIVLRRPEGRGDQPGERVGRSDQEAPQENLTSSFETSIPIQANEYIGIEWTSGSYFATPAGSITDSWTATALADGAAPTHPEEPLEVLVNADIEPDLDGDGLGDETKDEDDDGDGVDDTADGCPAVAAATTNGCPAAPPPAPRVNTPPTVRFRAPAAATAVGASQAVELEVSDDAGAPRVTVHDDDGTICTLTGEPYSCVWTPTGADVGRATLLASAVDSDGRSTLGIVRVNVSRFTATLTRKRSGRRVTGKLRLPAAVEPALGCKGAVTVRRGKAKRTTALKPNCTYSVRLPKASGAVKARFGGNPVVAPT